MRLKVLGAYGSADATHNLTGYVIDDRIATLFALWPFRACVAGFAGHQSDLAAREALSLQVLERLNHPVKVVFVARGCARLPQPLTVTATS